VVENAQALATALVERDFTLVSGGTDNHLILLDMSSKGLSGKEAATALARAGIVSNANSIPFDPRKPFDPSGVRIGSPAATSRGLTPAHMVQVAEWLDEVISAPTDDAVAEKVRAEVHDLMKRYPAPGCRAVRDEVV
jgi:glycine hydroxymethyltransferase